MTIRTTAVDVRKIVKTKPSHDLSPFIAAASQLVDDLCTTSKYSDDKLKRIETWLSAHFYCIQYSRRLQEMTSGTQQTFQSKVDTFLRLTHYGQMALMLDTELNLASMMNNAEVVRRLKKTLFWLGKDDE